MSAASPAHSTLEEALAVSQELSVELAAEIERTRTARRALARLDSGVLFAHAAAREEFHAKMAGLQSELALALEKVGEALEISEVTLASITEKAPEHGARLAAVFGQIRRFAQELEELNRIHRELLEKGLACVNAYLAAMRPPPAAYDKRGVAASGAEGQAPAVSRRV